MLVEEVNVRMHRAGRRGFDTGIVDIPTTESAIVSGDVYVSSIFISNPSAVAVTVTLKDGGSVPKTFYSATLAAGGKEEIHFHEPARFRGGIRAVASVSGAVMIVIGYS